ncbi:MAG TPA: hypothetical protein VEW48_20175 [Thermoanaerobaculia bacterium]|nr:hypothetical protein [Thermoanaerobaculia bacterium]
MSRKIALAIVLVLVLCATGAAHAVPFDSKLAESPADVSLVGGVWDRLLDWIGGIVGGGDGLFTQRMEGCHIDPNGRVLCCQTSSC